MQNDSELFWKLLEPEYSRAMLFCRKLMVDREHGDDLFQDGLVTALTKFRSLRDQSAFRPWLYRILINTFKSRARRKWLKRMVPLTADLELTLTGDDPVDRRSARRWLDRLFRAVSADDRSLITLHDLEGWPIADLAALYGKSEGSIKLKLFRARSKMKDALDALLKAGIDESGATKDDIEENPWIALKPEGE